MEFRLQNYLEEVQYVTMRAWNQRTIPVYRLAYTVRIDEDKLTHEAISTKSPHEAWCIARLYTRILVLCRMRRLVVLGLPVDT